MYVLGLVSTTKLDLSIAIRSRERIAQWVAVLIQCPPFEFTKCGKQSYESARRVSSLLSQFCTVQVLLGLENLLALQNTEVSTFQGFWVYTNICKYIQDQMKCLQYRRWPLLGVPKRRGSTVNCNLICPYHVLEISPRNSTLFIRPFVSGRCMWAGHKTKRSVLMGSFSCCTLWKQPKVLLLIVKAEAKPSIFTWLN